MYLIYRVVRLSPYPPARLLLHTPAFVLLIFRKDTPEEAVPLPQSQGNHSDALLSLSQLPIPHHGLNKLLQMKFYFLQFFSSNCLPTSSTRQTVSVFHHQINDYFFDPPVLLHYKMPVTQPSKHHFYHT